MDLVEIQKLATRFADKTLLKEKWTHQTHLIVAIWYIKKLSKEEATAYLRNAIIMYNNAIGIDNTSTNGYHETITLFWIWLINEFIIQNKTLMVTELVNHFLKSRFADQEIMLEYYSSELLFSNKARSNWVKPDIKQLSL